MDLRFSLLLMPFTMVFHFGHGTYLTDGSKLCADLRRRGWLVGGSVLSQQIFNCAQEHVDQSHLTTPLYQWRNSLQSSSRLKGLLGPSTSTPIASMCVRARTSSHSARNEAHTSHFGPDCSKLCRDLLVQSPHHFGQLPPVCDDTPDCGGQCCGWRTR